MPDALTPITNEASASTKFTAFNYLYRDASNYKVHDTVYLIGEFTPAQREAIKLTLDGNEFFIPAQVGLDSLQSQLESFPSADDHVWHELNFDEVEVLDTLPENTTAELTTTELANRFANVNFWDVPREMRRLGLDD